MNGQLSLFDPLETNGNGNGSGRPKTLVEAGLVKNVPVGAERLLPELVKRGLPEGDVKVAASLCLVLDEGAER